VQVSWLDLRAMHNLACPQRSFTDAMFSRVRMRESLHAVLTSITVGLPRPRSPARSLRCFIESHGVVGVEQKEVTLKQGN
jgi:hypothetical protein